MIGISPDAQHTEFSELREMMDIGTVPTLMAVPNSYSSLNCVSKVMPEAGSREKSPELMARNPRQDLCSLC